MTSPKVCVATTFDTGFSDVGAFAVASIELHAARWGFDTYVDGAATYERPMPWHRVKLIPELFAQGYDFVLWVDSDAVIVDGLVNIVDKVEPGKDLYLVEHDIDFSGSKVPNTGVMLLRNCPWTVSFLDAIWQMEDLLDHGWWDNAAAIRYFGYLNLLGEGPYAPDPEVMSHIKFLEECWNFIPQFSPLGSAYIHHLPAKSRTERRQQMPLMLMQNLENHLNAHPVVPLKRKSRLSKWWRRRKAKGTRALQRNAQK
ncbi:putative nucleotide-diphospho-sugar transferase [Tateyamaria sp. SN6-1]|uniref:putative nucleotide-diphospho-sugar transferase n=1 Tax=Tateyamaria sp. SN6-1 TaxID=3092148 RepID=UPI0039F49C05